MRRISNSPTLLTLISALELSFHCVFALLTLSSVRDHDHERGLYES